MGTREVEKLTEQVDIFNTEAFSQEVEKVTGTASKADTIAHRTKRTLKEKWSEEDPAFYKKFSRLIEDAIDDFRQHRISDVEYLQKVKEIMSHVINRTGDDIPERLQGEQVAVAFYGLIGEALAARQDAEERLQELKVQAALDIDGIIRKLRIVHWEDNDDIKNRMRNAIEDRLFELQDDHGIRLSFDEIDAIMESCIRNATIRYAS